MEVADVLVCSVKKVVLSLVIGQGNW